MNDLALELEQKADCIFRESNDEDLLEAAYFMKQAARSVKSFEVKMRKVEYTKNKEV